MRIIAHILSYMGNAKDSFYRIFTGAIIPYIIKDHCLANDGQGFGIWSDSPIYSSFAGFAILYHIWRVSGCLYIGHRYAYLLLCCMFRHYRQKEGRIWRVCITGE